MIVVANADGRNLPKIILNGGTLNSVSHYNQIGTVTLNSGATLIQTGEQPNGSTGYDGWQFLGDFNVGGNAPSTISTNNGSYNHLGINTTFNVADVTGNANPDLIVSAGLRNRSGDYGTGVGNFIKTGFGTMLISAMNTPTGQNYANTYTGSTTVNQGTLSVGMANGINAASALILGGGKFDTGGFSQTMNTLTLNATSSAIDMGTQSAIMTFASSAANTWTAGRVLSIDNWSGTLTGGGTDQLIVGTTTSGLTAAQLSEIHFEGFNGAKMLANGEVVPASASTRLLGDFNFDGHVNAADLTAAMTALSDLNAFKSSGSLSSEDLLNIADVDGSGSRQQCRLAGVDHLPAKPATEAWPRFPSRALSPWPRWAWRQWRLRTAVGGSNRKSAHSKVQLGGDTSRCRAVALPPRRWRVRCVAIPPEFDLSKNNNCNGFNG